MSLASLSWQPRGCRGGLAAPYVATLEERVLLGGKRTLGRAVAKPVVASIAQATMTGLIITIPAPHQAMKLGGAGGVIANIRVIASRGVSSNPT